MRKFRTPLFSTILMFILCASIVAGSTLAYFTTEVQSSSNVIASANLKAGFLWSADGQNWQDAKTTTIFTHQRWEPNYTDVKYIQVRNEGALAFQYELNIVPTFVSEGEGNLLDVIDVYYGVEPSVPVTRDNFKTVLQKVGTLSDLLINDHGAGYGILLPANASNTGDLTADELALTRIGSANACIALHMQETAGNEYQGASVGDGFRVTLNATQYNYEADAFGRDYDQDADLPTLSVPAQVTVAVTPDENGFVPADVLMESKSSGISALVPAGARMEEGARSLTLTVLPMDESFANVKLEKGEVKSSYQVHVGGLAADNDKPIIVNMGEVLPKGLNMGNYQLYHVETIRTADPQNPENITETQETTEMTYVKDASLLTAHNDFTYNPATGMVTVAMATFSEVALVADTEKAWEGNFDYSWYDASKTELTIANADQLAAFGAIVGGMAEGIKQDSFSGKTVKLISDINLDDDEENNKKDEENNKENIIFYPIGYNSSDGKYEKTGVAVTTGFYTFEGTFDGNGHTIANFYQNTWEMKGDHDWYSPAEQYYRDGMGLFGKVYSGTVKNLTVSNFSSDGEIATTGVIAAYADGATFENIAITNCNPRVYNIGNGGIVGCVGWYAKEANLKTNFKNITVDNSNKISALWGSYDVACGGIVGQYYPTSGQTSAGTPKNAGIHFENCHVSAQMDVYNDVCANYQYYAYRYTGMMIGSIRENETINGYVYPKMDDITASGCTVHFGDWNDYYYCELVANSLASYTHDHQMSRLEQVTKVEGTTITPLKGDAFTVPASGRYNYVVVDGKHATDNATCYHFVDGKVHNHDDYNGDGVEDFETVNGESVRVEDKRHIYLEFNQLFTGYGWGVTSKGLKDFEGIDILDITEGEIQESEVKFEKAVSAEESYTTGTTVQIDDLFKAATIKNNKLAIQGDKVQVFVSPADENSTAGGTYIANTTDWTQGTLTFSGTGAATITITDYYFCTPTTINVTVSPRSRYNVTFEADGVEVATCTYTEGDKELTGTIPTVPEKTGYTGEWKPYDLSVNQDITVEAIYTPIEYTLTFMADGKTVETRTYTVKTDKDNIDLPAVQEKPGYTGKWPDFELAIGGTIVEAVYTKIPAEFAPVFEHTDKYTYRVGNANAVSLSSLFKLTNEAIVNVDSLDVTVVTTKGNASGKYTSNAIWSNGSIKFSGTGLVDVTINTNDDKPCTLQLEVVDAVNATGATSVKSNNVVLLNDVGLYTIEVSNGYTLYGNGFKMTATNDVMYDTMRAGFVTLNNGTLDNVQIICPNFSYSIIYNNQIKDSANTAVPSDTSNDARGNVRSAVMADGNSKIINSYVHGGRAAVFLRSGNLVIDGSTISGGATANIHALSAQSLTLKNATLIQRPFQATVHDTSKTIMGFSGLFECDAEGNSTPLILEGTLIQDAWVNEADKQYVGDNLEAVIKKALSQTTYLHDIDGDGEAESLNLGFTYIPQENGSKITVDCKDNRTNKSNVPYESVEISASLIKAIVFSYKNTNGTLAAFKNVGEFEPFAQGPIAPTLSYTDTNADRIFETKFDTSDNRWESTLTVNLDNGNYTFSFDKLLAQKHGNKLSYTVKTESNTAVDISKPIALTASGVTNYVLTVTDGDVTHTVYFILTATKTSIPDPVVADTTGGTPLLVVKSKNSDWTVGLPALEGIKVKYYTADGEVILDLATLTPTSTGKQNGTNNYWETTKDGYKLKVTCGVIHDTKSVYGMPVVVDNNGTKQMYFTISSTNGYVSTGTAARSVTLTYEFTDPNGKTLTFTKNYNVKYADYKDEAQYSYSDFVKGTMNDLLKSSSGGGSGGCVTPDTLITLANGAQVRVDSLTGNEMLLVWNMEKGMLDEAGILFVDNDPEAEYEIIHLYFSDGTDVKVIYEHGFWDYDLNKYIYLDADAARYIGHTFAKQNGDRLEKVMLTDVVIEKEITTAWSPVTENHLCYFVNGMLSMPGGVGGLFNIFDVDPATMTYDMEALARDIETYGLFTYEELNAIVELPEEMFNAAGGAYMKISMGKGNLTMDELIAMIERYTKFF